MRMNKLLLALVITIISVTACSTRVYSPEGSVTTVIMIRHADRDTGDSMLNDFGIARAAALPEAVSEYNIQAIYSPNLTRNIDTVKPLSNKIGVAITLVDSKPDVNMISKRLLNEHPGKTVLWVGNTSNLGLIFANLGGEGTPPVEYGDLYILEVPESGFTNVSRLVFEGK